MVVQLVLGALMGLLLLGVVLWVARGIDWRSNDLIVSREDGEGLAGLANSPVLWVVAFLGLALGLTGIALFAVLDIGVGQLVAAGIPKGLAQAVLNAAPTIASAAIGSIVLLFLVGGTYAAARDRNVSSAGATLMVTLILGTLLLVAISGQLLSGP